MRGETATLARSPEEVIALFAARMSAGDVTGALELYEDGASFAPEPGAILGGRAAIRGALAGFAALEPRMGCAADWVQVAGDTALVLNHWTLNGRGEDGEAVHLTGRSADVMRRGPDGGWRFLIDCPWAGEGSS
jgi:ketosteroid isomerase-like protein